MNVFNEIFSIFGKKQKIIVLLGQTATGKTALSIDIAAKYKGEIISADSRQVYLGLDLGSGKVTKDETEGIPHYMIDVVNINHVYSVYEYQQAAKKHIKYILHRDKLPIICGGTGMYIDAVIYNQEFANIPANQELRDKLENLSTHELLERLSKSNQKWSKEIDTANRQRIIRAIEIIESGGIRPKLNRKTLYDILFIGLRMDSQDELHKRIYNRIMSRIDEGMITEVQELMDSGISSQRLYSLGLEYRYISEYLENKISYEEMIQKLFTEIKHFAKRQNTWFKRNKKIHWYNPSQVDDIHREINNFLKK